MEPVDAEPLSWDAASFDRKWTEWLQTTFFDPRKHNAYASLVRANAHIPSDETQPEGDKLWHMLRQTGRLPAGIPLLCPFASAGSNMYCQARIDRVKRYVHRLAAAAFAVNGRAQYDDTSLEACHRIMGYPGSRRDMNPSNLYFESGEFNRSQRVCKLLFLRTLNVREDEYNAELFETSHGFDAPRFRAAVNDVHLVCTRLHTRDKCCLFFNPESVIGRRYGLNHIAREVATTLAVGDLAAGLTGTARKQMNIAEANNRTGLNL